MWRTGSSPQRVAVSDDRSGCRASIAYLDPQGRANGPNLVAGPGLLQRPFEFDGGRGSGAGS